MQRKRLRKDDFFSIPSKLLGRERSVSRSREHPRTVVATLLHEQTSSSISRLISATAALGRLTHILAEKNTMTVLGTGRALVITVATMAKTEIAIIDGIVSGISAADTTVILGAAAAVTLGKEWTITRGARTTLATKRILDVSLRISQAAVSILKLVMIIQVICVFECCTGA